MAGHGLRVLVGAGVFAVSALGLGDSQQAEKESQQAETLVTSSTSNLQVSGIYPHMAFFNDESECGTGAVVPWAGSLWAITYAPHEPEGSTDKLYQIQVADGAGSPGISRGDGMSSPALTQIVRGESIGGTPANRMIHRESNQLFIGPYVINEEGRVRTIPYSEMFGRPTANARHLFDPANKVYCATMEEGLYEVDVHTLSVTELWRDEQLEGGRKSELPGYHGKGLYSGHGRVVYANNGEHGSEAKRNPRTPSGVLAEWDGRDTSWTVVRRNQFTEVTGPGGIYGNKNPDEDPVWTIGWDHRSLILMALDKGGWKSWRLPKASHSYDGAHGWNTEWPRIRDIGEQDLLMTMHGTFWRFPKGFSAESSGGIRPRSNYLKVVGDFTRWGDLVVFGCDDTARAEFLNRRRAKGKIAAPQSQSNLWFVEPQVLDELGPALGRGAVWLDDPVQAGDSSDPYLFAGYTQRSVFIESGDKNRDVDFELQVDRQGNGKWETLTTVTVRAGEAFRYQFPSSDKGEWIRAVATEDCPAASVVFFYGADDAREEQPDGIFNGLARAGETSVTGGLVRAMADNKRRLAFGAVDSSGKAIGYYEMGQDLRLTRVEDTEAHKYHMENTALPGDVLQVDEASVLYVDDSGKRWRLPKGSDAFDDGGTFGSYRIDREVATERDMFNACGIFYELPAENAGGFAGVRPVATHNLMIHDFCSYAGLLVISGLSLDARSTGPHVVRSNDGLTSLWVGALDDVWKLGKVRGFGGPWKNSEVVAGEASDPFLLTGFDQKRLQLSADSETTITAEVDLTGNGKWVPWKSFAVSSGGEVSYEFPSGFQAYWIRFVSSTDCRASAMLRYD